MQKYRRAANQEDPLPAGNHTGNVGCEALSSGAGIGATLSKIEAQLRCVSDAELLIPTKALKMELKELFQNGEAAIPILCFNWQLSLAVSTNQLETVLAGNAYILS